MATFEPNAMAVREVDSLVSKLLTDIKVPYSSLGKRVLNQFADLKKVLAADYCNAPGMPPTDLLKELALLVERDIKTQKSTWHNWENPALYASLSRGAVGPRELEVRAEPYREGAGLSLRGFFCRTEVDSKRKFVIFLNTAHHPGAVAATFGHELGHYIYGSLVGETHEMTAFMEGTFASHLLEQEELFGDSLVALSAYNRELIQQIGPIDNIIPGSAEELFSRIKKVYALIGPRYKLDLERSPIGAAWRV